MPEVILWVLVGSLVVAFSLAPQLAAAADAPPRLPGSLNNNRMLDAWLRLDADGTATIFPGNMAVGATGDPAVARQVATAAAT